MDQSDMDILFYCALIVILFFMLDKFFHRPKSTDDKQEIVTNKNGWVQFNLDLLLKDGDNKKLIDSFMADSHDNDWKDDFIKKYFHRIHYMNSQSLLNLCKEMHTNVNLSDIDKNNAKRVITACAILFNFSLPITLFILDKTTMSIVIQYYSITKTLITDIDKIDIDALAKSTGAEILQMKEIIKILDYGFFYVSRSSSRNPNIIHLMDIIKKNNFKLFNMLSGDINNLRKLLTVCYFLSGVHIPSDYLIMDKSIYLYLKDSQHFSKRVRSHLSVV